jgi:hypothetical protein
MIADMLGTLLSDNDRRKIETPSIMHNLRWKPPERIPVRLDLIAADRPVYKAYIHPGRPQADRHLGPHPDRLLPLMLLPQRVDKSVADLAVSHRKHSSAEGSWSA